MEEPKEVRSVSLEDLYQSRDEDTPSYPTYPISKYDYKNSPFYKACWFLVFRLAEILCEKESKARSHLQQLVLNYIKIHNNEKKPQDQVMQMKGLLEKIGLQTLLTGKKCDAVLLDIPIKCLEGTLTRLEGLLNYLNADPTHALYLAKREVIQAFATQYVEQKIRCSNGLKIHRVNDMVRSVKHRFNVNQSSHDYYMRDANQHSYKAEAAGFNKWLDTQEDQIAEGIVESLT